MINKNYNKGDIVRIIANTSSHSWNNGELVTILEIPNRRSDYYKGISELGRTYYLGDDDCELSTPNRKYSPNGKLITV